MPEQNMEQGKKVDKWHEPKGEISYICERCGTKHYVGRWSYCCDFDDIGGK